MYLLHNELMS